MTSRVSVVVPTHNRKEEIQDTVESVAKQTHEEKELVVISDSDDGTREFFAEKGKYDYDWIEFRHIEGRIGITAALNKAIDVATGDYVVTLDDDSYFTSPDAMTTIVETFQSHPTAGLLGFRVENEHSGEEEFPGWKTEGPGLTGKIPFISPIVDLPTGEDVKGPIETTYFPGCGYAVRSTLYDAIREHPSTFDYGAYEDDLAFRIHKTNYEIHYLPSVTVKHKRSPKGTLPEKDRILLSYTNNVAVAVRHLPWRYVLLNAVLWGGSTLVHTDYDIASTLKALKQVFEQRDLHMQAREVVDSETIGYIKSRGGRLY